MPNTTAAQKAKTAKNAAKTSAKAKVRGGSRPAAPSDMDAVLAPYIAMFDVEAAKMANKSVAQKTEFLLKHFSEALLRVRKLGTATAAKHGVAWDFQKSLLDNLERLFAALGTQAPPTTDTGLGDAEIRAIAEQLNQQLPYPLSKLPESGSEAIRMVLSLRSTGAK